MFYRILCKFGIHYKCQFRMEELFEIEKCRRCGLVFKFAKLSDKLVGLQIDDKIFPM